MEVILTRDDDKGLYKSSDSSKKMADMKQRCQTIAETDPDIVVSVHQNSYHQEYPAVRYFTIRVRKRVRSWLKKYRKGLIMFLVKKIQDLPRRMTTTISSCM